MSALLFFIFCHIAHILVLNITRVSNTVGSVWCHREQIFLTQLFQPCSSGCEHSIPTKRVCLWRAANQKKDGLNCRMGLFQTKAGLKDGLYFELWIMQNYSNGRIKIWRWNWAEQVYFNSLTFGLFLWQLWICRCNVLFMCVCVQVRMWAVCWTALSLLTRACWSNTSVTMWTPSACKSHPQRHIYTLRSL